MKKSLLIVALALIITVTPVLAASPGKIFTVLGTIEVITGDDITANVVDTNKFAASYVVDGQLTVTVTGSTKYYQYVADGTNIPITFDDIDVGDTVNIRGRLISGDLIAQVVTIGVKCPD